MMVRKNMVALNPERAYFACIACGERTFSSQEHLYQHCRNAKIHQGEWCDYCEWLFVSPQALASHLRDSSAHWICSICDFDSNDEDSLAAHMASIHDYCYECSDTFNKYRAHRIEYHNRCAQCDEEFSTQNEVEMV